MSYAGITPTKFGRFHVAEPFRPDRLHLHNGGPLKLVDHEPPVPVLDQEDLNEQGIDTSKLIPGAQRVDALGSCVPNAGTVSLAERYAAKHGASSLDAFGLKPDAVALEEYAIVLYHRVTSRTGQQSTEWPPTDCGSSGLDLCSELENLGLVGSHKTATGATNIVSLLQDGTVIQGTPWFRSWFEPDAHGFIDGDGGIDDLLTAVRSGLAGNHETCITAVEQLHIDLLGRVDADKTVLRVRNSWSRSFADNGSFRVHLSTLDMLAGHCDFRQLVIAA